jgi:TrmH family RNA methyltransferase
MAITITSRQNPRFKAALALRDARDRREQGRLIVDGPREIGRALEAGVPATEAWVAPNRVRADAARVLLPRLAAAGAEIIETSGELLGRLTYGERDDGLLAVLRAPSTDLADLRLPAESRSSPPLIAVVEGVEKPGNLGALLRSADGAGVDAVMVADPASDIWNPNAVRASLGTIFRMPLAVCSATEAVAYLREHGLAVVAARVDGEVDYDAADLRGPVAIVVGSEVEGLSDAWSGARVTSVRIPMLGVADSLNVSATAAVLFYEARRQRRAGGSQTD